MIVITLCVLQGAARLVHKFLHEPENHGKNKVELEEDMIDANQKNLLRQGESGDNHESSTSERESYDKCGDEMSSDEKVLSEMAAVLPVKEATILPTITGDDAQIPHSQEEKEELAVQCLAGGSSPKSGKDPCSDKKVTPEEESATNVKENNSLIHPTQQVEEGMAEQQVAGTRSQKYGEDTCPDEEVVPEQAATFPLKEDITLHVAVSEDEIKNVVTGHGAEESCGKSGDDVSSDEKVLPEIATILPMKEANTLPTITADIKDEVIAAQHIANKIGNTTDDVSREGKLVSEEDATSSAKADNTLLLTTSEEVMVAQQIAKGCRNKSGDDISSDEKVVPEETATGKESNTQISPSQQAEEMLSVEFVAEESSHKCGEDTCANEQVTPEKVAATAVKEDDTQNSSTQQGGELVTVKRVANKNEEACFDEVVVPGEAAGLPLEEDNTLPLEEDNTLPLATSEDEDQNVTTQHTAEECCDRSDDDISSDGRVLAEMASNVSVKEDTTLPTTTVYISDEVMAGQRIEDKRNYNTEDAGSERKEVSEQDANSSVNEDNIPTTSEEGMVAQQIAKGCCNKSGDDISSDEKVVSEETATSKESNTQISPSQQAEEMLSVECVAEESSPTNGEDTCANEQVTPEKVAATTVKEENPPTQQGGELVTVKRVANKNEDPCFDEVVVPGEAAGLPLEQDNTLPLATSEDEDQNVTTQHTAEECCDRSDDDISSDGKVLAEMASNVPVKEDTTLPTTTVYIPDEVMAGQRIEDKRIYNTEEAGSERNEVSEQDANSSVNEDNIPTTSDEGMVAQQIAEGCCNKSGDDISSDEKVLTEETATGKESNTQISPSQQAEEMLSVECVAEESAPNGGEDTCANEQVTPEKVAATTVKEENPPTQQGGELVTVKRVANKNEDPCFDEVVVPGEAAGLPLEEDNTLPLATSENEDQNVTTQHTAEECCDRSDDDISSDGKVLAEMASNVPVKEDTTLPTTTVYIPDEVMAGQRIEDKRIYNTEDAGSERNEVSEQDANSSVNEDNIPTTSDEGMVAQQIAEGCCNKSGDDISSDEKVLPEETATGKESNTQISPSQQAEEMLSVECVAEESSHKCGEDTCANEQVTPEKVAATAVKEDDTQNSSTQQGGELVTVKRVANKNEEACFDEVVVPEEAAGLPLEEDNTLPLEEDNTLPLATSEDEDQNVTTQHTAEECCDRSDDDISSDGRVLAEMASNVSVKEDTTLPTTTVYISDEVMAGQRIEDKRNYNTEDAGSERKEVSEQDANSSVNEDNIPTTSDEGMVAQQIAKGCCNKSGDDISSDEKVVSEETATSKESNTQISPSQQAEEMLSVECVAEESSPTNGEDTCANKQVTPEKVAATTVKEENPPTQQGRELVTVKRVANKNEDPCFDEVVVPGEAAGLPLEEDNTLPLATSENEDQNVTTQHTAEECCDRSDDDISSDGKVLAEMASNVPVKEDTTLPTTTVYISDEVMAGQRIEDKRNYNTEDAGSERKEVSEQDANSSVKEDNIPTTSDEGMVAQQIAEGCCNKSGDDISSDEKVLPEETATGKESNTQISPSQQPAEPLPVQEDNTLHSINTEVAVVASAFESDGQDCNNFDDDTDLLLNATEDCRHCGIVCIEKNSRRSDIEKELDIGILPNKLISPSPENSNVASSLSFQGSQSHQSEQDFSSKTTGDIKAEKKTRGEKVIMKPVILQKVEATILQEVKVKEVPHKSEKDTFSKTCDGMITKIPLWKKAKGDTTTVPSQVSTVINDMDDKEMSHQSEQAIFSKNVGDTCAVHTKKTSMATHSTHPTRAITKKMKKTRNILPATATSSKQRVEIKSSSSGNGNLEATVTKVKAIPPSLANKEIENNTKPTPITEKHARTLTPKTKRNKHRNGDKMQKKSSCPINRPPAGITDGNFAPSLKAEIWAKPASKKAAPKGGTTTSGIKENDPGTHALHVESAVNEETKVMKTSLLATKLSTTNNNKLEEQNKLHANDPKSTPTPATGNLMDMKSCLDNSKAQKTVTSCCFADTSKPNVRETSIPDTEFAAPTSNNRENQTSKFHVTAHNSKHISSTAKLMDLKSTLDKTELQVKVPSYASAVTSKPKVTPPTAQSTIINNQDTQKTTLHPTASKTFTKPSAANLLDKKSTLYSAKVQTLVPSYAFAVDNRPKVEGTSLFDTKHTITNNYQENQKSTLHATAFKCMSKTATANMVDMNSSLDNIKVQRKVLSYASAVTSDRKEKERSLRPTKPAITNQIQENQNNTLHAPALKSLPKSAALLKDMRSPLGNAKMPKKASSYASAVTKKSEVPRASLGTTGPTTVNNNQENQKTKLHPTAPKSLPLPHSENVMEMKKILAKTKMQKVTPYASAVTSVKTVTENSLPATQPPTSTNNQDTQKSELHSTATKTLPKPSAANLMDMKSTRSQNPKMKKKVPSFASVVTHGAKPTETLLSATKPVFTDNNQVNQNSSVHATSSKSLPYHSAAVMDMKSTLNETTVQNQVPSYASAVTSNPKVTEPPLSAKTASTDNSQKNQKSTLHGTAPRSKPSAADLIIIKATHDKTELQKKVPSHASAVTIKPKETELSLPVIKLEATNNNHENQNSTLHPNNPQSLLKSSTANLTDVNPTLGKAKVQRKALSYASAVTKKSEVTENSLPGTKLVFSNINQESQSSTVYTTAREGLPNPPSANLMCMKSALYSTKLQKKVPSYASAVTSNPKGTETSLSATKMATTVNNQENQKSTVHVTAPEDLCTPSVANVMATSTLNKTKLQKKVPSYASVITGRQREKEAIFLATKPATSNNVLQNLKLVQLNPVPCDVLKKTSHSPPGIISHMKLTAATRVPSPKQKRRKIIRPHVFADGHQEFPFGEDYHPVSTMTYNCTEEKSKVELEIPVNSPAVNTNTWQTYRERTYNYDSSSPEDEVNLLDGRKVKKLKKKKQLAAATKASYSDEESDSSLESDRNERTRRAKRNNKAAEEETGAKGKKKRPKSPKPSSAAEIMAYFLGPDDAPCNIILNFDSDFEFKMPWGAEAEKPFYNTKVEPPADAIPDWEDTDSKKEPKTENCGNKSDSGETTI